MIDLGGGNSIEGESRINIVLGKNGSGKSTLLRLMDHRLSGGDACIRYITPERGGELTYDGGIETQRSANPNWLSGQRRRNQYNAFRQSAVTEFRNLETAVLRSIESDPDIRSSEFRFDSEIERINQVLDRVALRRADGASFEIIRKEGGARAEPRDLSSGESELISLSIEILYFSYLCKQEKYIKSDNWILLDEPDVHLHPDLQYRLMDLLVSSMDGVNGRVMIATHSTAVLSAVCSLCPDVQIGFKQLGNQVINFRGADDALKSILPMFGAHPLSNVFNQKPPLIVEGEDDERIWHAAARSSQGRIEIYPCVAGDIQSLNGYETAARELIDSVYNNARAFSLRDRDDDPYEIDDLGPVVRSRLNCRSAENLILSDDVLDVLGTSWADMQDGIAKWIDDNPGHSRYADAVAFRDSGWDRSQFDLKNLRMVLIGISGSNKPWEVAVGQAITKLPENRFDGLNCLQTYLGPKLVEALNLMGNDA